MIIMQRSPSYNSSTRSLDTDIKPTFDIPEDFPQDMYYTVLSLYALSVPQGPLYASQTQESCREVEG